MQVAILSINKDRHVFAINPRKIILAIPYDIELHKFLIGTKKTFY